MAVFLFQLDGFSKWNLEVKQYVHSNFNSSIVILSLTINNVCLLALESISFLVFSNMKDTLNIAIICVILNNNQESTI